MPRWSAALTQAGISDPRLRRDYDAQRKLVRRYRRKEYLAARLLLPARLQPDVMAAVAFMHETDRRIDLGDAGVRQASLRSWDWEVRAALDGADTESGTLRALADTARRHPEVATQVHDFLSGAPVEAASTGFDSEADLQRYVDVYSMPALMLTVSLIGPRPGTEQYEPFVRGCRKLIEAMQRTDFLADLPEDLEQGHIGIPRQDLERHGLDVKALCERPRESAAALEGLAAAQVALADRAFSECRDLPALVEAEYRPFLRALTSVQELRLQAVQSNSGSLLQTGASPSDLAAVRILWHEYRAAGRGQR